MTRSLLSLLFITAFLLSPGMLRADEIRPAFLQLTEVDPGFYNVYWKVPALNEFQRLAIDVRFDDSVSNLSERQRSFMDGADIQQWQIRREGGLDGATVVVDGLPRMSTEVLFRVQHLDGSATLHRLTPDNPEYVIAGGDSLGQVIWTYTVLGVEHILIGLDHLLFVLALLLLVKGVRKLIATITAFTLAHSITLSIAALDLVRIPVPPVEAIIALSIVFVAGEILRSQNGRPALAASKPWLVAFSFGLLHGLGFAAALGEIGMPQSAVPAALLFFNIGVELGQLMFVAVVLGVIWLFHRLPVQLPPWWYRVPPYTIGGLASFWVVERVAGFVV